MSSNRTSGKERCRICKCLVKPWREFDVYELNGSWLMTCVSPEGMELVAPQQERKAERKPGWFSGRKRKTTSATERKAPQQSVGWTVIEVGFIVT